MSEQKCKWLSDDFSEVCASGDCPVCADFCPVTQHSEICKFAEFEGKKRTNADKIRGMTDEELAKFIKDTVVTEFRHHGLIGMFESGGYWLDWLEKEGKE